MRDAAQSRLLRWLLWAVYAALWTTALLTTFPLAVRDRIVPAQYGFPVSKTLHVAAYGLFTVLTGWLPLSRPWRWAMLGLVSLHAWGTEYVQQFVGRTGSLRDVGLDHIGIALGLLLSWKLWRPAAGPRR
jgi:VanZ family protein